MFAITEMRTVCNRFCLAVALAVNLNLSPTFLLKLKQAFSVSALKM
jgi:hypothetical protein